MSEKAAEMALNAFASQEKNIKSVEEMSSYAQYLVTIGVKIMAGIEGQQFKNDFLTAGIEDTEVINPMVEKCG